MGVGQILERDYRAFAVVVPTEHVRQERRAARLRVEDVLVADPRRRVVPGGAIFTKRAGRPAVATSQWPRSGPSGTGRTRHASGLTFSARSRVQAASLGALVHDAGAYRRRRPRLHPSWRP